MTFAEFQRAMARGDVPPVVVFHGEEPYLATLGVDILRKRLIAPGAEAFDFVSLAGRETTAEAIAAHASTVPMLSEKRLAVVYEFEGLPPSQRNQLVSYAADPVESACVALVSFKRLEGKNKFENALLSSAVVVECGRPAPEQLTELVGRMAEKRGMEIDECAASALVEWTDGSLNRISGELDKLSCFVEEGNAIGLEAVEAVVGARTSSLGDLALAIAERDRGRALALLDEVVEGGMDEAQLVSRLYGYWIALWLARTGRGARSGAARAAGYGRLWSGRSDLRELAGGRTSREYVHGIERFYRADVDIRRGMPARPVVGLLVYELVSGAS
jgi:DNA polymerase-3 subunit delta